MLNVLGKASWAQAGGSFPKSNVSGNSLFRARLSKSRSFGRSIGSQGRPFRTALSSRRFALPPFLDILEPFETIWEFYCNREEIMEEMAKHAAQSAKRNSVRALGLVMVAFGMAEALARLGIIGDKGEGLADFFRESEAVRGAVEERMMRKSGHYLADSTTDILRRYRRWNSKSKFAVAVSVGSLASRAAIKTTMYTLKLGLTTFVVLEGLAFAGIIGEPGESLFDWIDDQRDQSAEWQKNIKRFRLAVRRNTNLGTVSKFYKVAVDEEKVTCCGFAMGSIIGMLFD